LKEFVTAAKTAESAIENAEPIKFKIDDRELTAYPPKDGQVMLFMAAIGEGASPINGVVGIIDLLDGIFEEDDKSYYRGRLMDRKDPFGIKDVEQIMEYLLEEWSARPTTSPSGSMASPPRTGPNSTAKRRSVAATSPG
jgi:hypothetical protein